jgi:RNA polymerase sigma factor (TIGR02999 family)
LFGSRKCSPAASRAIAVARQMSNVTHLLAEIASGDPSAAKQLLPLVYDELRKLAAARMAQEKPGQTLQTTALVHEAYIRLVDTEKAQHRDARGHFFAAAAEAMRRIIVEGVRRRRRMKRGGDRMRVDAGELDLVSKVPDERLFAIDEALDILDRDDPSDRPFKRR